MCQNNDDDLGDQVDKAFDEIGGGLLDAGSRNSSLEHLEAHPFFLDADGKVPFNSGNGRKMLTAIIPRFDLGKIVGTTKFKQVVLPDEAIVALARHAIGDWGDLGLRDRNLNQEYMERCSGRLISRFVSVRSGYAFYIITDGEGLRKVTLGLMVEEFKND